MPKNQYEIEAVVYDGNSHANKILLQFYEMTSYLEQGNLTLSKEKISHEEKSMQKTKKGMLIDTAIPL